MIPPLAAWSTFACPSFPLPTYSWLGTWLLKNRAGVPEMGTKLAKTFARYRGHLGPLGPKLEKSPKKSSRAPRPRGPKSRKQSRKRVKLVEKQSIFTLFRLRFRLFGPRGREAPGTLFRTLFPTLGPRGPNDPCSRARESQYEASKGSKGISSL